MITTKPLGEIATFVGGGTPSKKNPDYWNGGIPWASVKDLNCTTLTKTVDNISKEGVENSATKIIPKGNIIIATRMALGKAIINEMDVAINQDLKAVYCSDEVFPRYLYHYINAKSAYIESLGKGATVKGVTLAVLRGIEVPLPALSEQKRIAAILDKADSIRRKRQESLDLADTFLRSVFLKMFGDPALNPDEYTFRILDEVAVEKGIKCGPFGTQLSKSEFCSTGVPLWGIKHVNSGFAKRTVEFVSEEKAGKLADYDIVAGDIVMTRKGTIGNCSVYPDDLPIGIMHSDLLRIRTDCKQIDYTFLDAQLKYSRLINAQLRRVSSGAIMAGINVSKLKNIEVFTPSLKRQKEYSEIVQKYKALASNLVTSAQSANHCFSSLQQRAFQGDL